MKGDLKGSFLLGICPLRMWRWKLSHIEREEAGIRKGLQEKHR